MDFPGDPRLVGAIQQVAPGQPLREGMDRILQARMGALIVLGDGPEILSICSGGFLVDAEFSPQRLYELAKMDGAIILSRDGSRLARANVHLVPDPSITTAETGTRHRTAERVAKCVEVPVIAVSEELAVITVYRHTSKRQLKSVQSVVARANQALSTLERYKERLDQVLERLNSLEISSRTTFKDVITVLQRAEMVRRISGEINWYLLELGSDGRLLSLQLDELSLDIEDNYDSVISDFLGPCTDDDVVQITAYLSTLSTEELLDARFISEGIASLSTCIPLQARADEDRLSVVLPSKGKRLFSLVPGLPQSVQDAIVAVFPDIGSIARISVDDLVLMSGIEARWATIIKEHIDAHLDEAQPV